MFFFIINVFYLSMILLINVNQMINLYLFTNMFLILYLNHQQ